ncbi:MAG: hypothetical protein GWN64_10035, partial [Candidatus Thorarchaeota archaeon]|nr:hypothetical protein [Candidatus Thorarchaeota archaeon]
MGKEIIELSRDEREHALVLFRESIVIDCHLDSVLTDDYIRQMIRSGVTAVNLDAGSFEGLAEKRSLINENPEIFIGPVFQVSDIIKAKKEGKIAVFLGSEDAGTLLNATEGDLHLNYLEPFSELGLK